MSSTRLAPAAFVKHATDVASFYGFRPVRELEKQSGRSTTAKRGIYTFESATTILGTSVEKRAQEPALAFYATPTPSYAPQAFPVRDLGEFGLSVVGSAESLGEVVLIKTLTAIISEWGGKIARIRLNALGDKDSQMRFVREVGIYLRKRGVDLHPECRNKAGVEPLFPYQCTELVCRQVLEGGPRPVNFLSEKSRVHFRSVLEHLEHLGLPYELDDMLIGDAREPRVVFAVDLAEDDATVVESTGGRFDDYLRRTTGRKDTSGVHGSIFFRKKGLDRAHFSSGTPLKSPKVYFVQLGLRAKLQGLTVVDMLREAHVPVSQSFDAKRLTNQLTAAHSSGVSHLLIMGQREALDGTVIVRSTKNNSQTILQLAHLPRFLKTIK